MKGYKSKQLRKAEQRKRDERIERAKSNLAEQRKRNELIERAKSNLIERVNSRLAEQQSPVQNQQPAQSNDDNIMWNNNEIMANMMKKKNMPYVEGTKDNMKKQNDINYNIQMSDDSNKVKSNADNMKNNEKKDLNWLPNTHDYNNQSEPYASEWGTNQVLAENPNSRKNRVRHALSDNDYDSQAEPYTKGWGNQPLKSEKKDNVAKDIVDAASDAATNLNPAGVAINTVEKGVKVAKEAGGLFSDIFGGIGRIATGIAEHRGFGEIMTHTFEGKDYDPTQEQKNQIALEKQKGDEQLKADKIAAKSSRVKAKSDLERQKAIQNIGLQSATREAQIRAGNASLPQITDYYKNLAQSQYNIKSTENPLLAKEKAEKYDAGSALRSRKIQDAIAEQRAWNDEELRKQNALISARNVVDQQKQQEKYNERQMDLQLAQTLTQQKYAQNTYPAAKTKKKTKPTKHIISKGKIKKKKKDK